MGAAAIGRPLADRAGAIDADLVYYCHGTLKGSRDRDGDAVPQAAGVPTAAVAAAGCWRSPAL
jgi:hypothetical protein